MEYAYKEAYKLLNGAQRQAVDSVEGPLLVIAGPGTGKTQLLSVRIAHILAKTDSLPQNILCLTFTESAAQTMRERLVNLIGQSAYDVTISTYHAFGSELIHRFPDYFDEMQGRRPADDLAIDTLFRHIIDALPYSNPLKFADNYIEDIKSFVSDAKRALLTPKDLRNIAKDNQSFLEKAAPVIAHTLKNHTRIDKKSVTDFRQLQSALSRLGCGGELPPGTTALVTYLLQQLTKALDEVSTTDTTKALTRWKNVWLIKNEKGLLILNGERLNQRLQALANIYNSYLNSLIKNGLFDYDDMILKAVAVLKKNKDLRYTLQEQYLYILLDEFQDTNAAQFEIIKLLSDNPVNEKRPNVLAVGDDDQAIYAFQGANYSHLLEFQRLYRQVPVIVLTKNYRSTPDILYLASNVAEQIQERARHYFPNVDKKIVAVKHDSSKAIIERREAKSDVAHYAWTANRIKSLVNQGVPASKIAVLAPQHKYLEPLVAFLHAQNLSVRYDRRENVLDDPAINQLIKMSELCLALSTADNAKSDSLWPEVLSFDFWNLSTSSIWQLSWAASASHSPWTNLLLKQKNFRSIALFFIRLGAIANNETLEAMLDYLIGISPLALHETDRSSFESPFYNYYFSSSAQTDKLGLFWQLLTNLTVLRSHLREYRPNETSPLLLKDFLSFVKDHHNANVKIINTSPYHEADQAVQLMTAFKAKGQEFAAVFLIACNDEAWGSRAISQNSRLALPINLQYIRYPGATNDERLRLFYVAITRAKNYLFLVNYLNTFAGRSTNHLKYLDESTDVRGVLKSPLLPKPHQRILSVGDEKVTPSTELNSYWQHRHQSALTKKDFKALLKHRLKRFQLSPTHIKTFVDLSHGGPNYFFIHSLLHFPTSPTPVSQYGNAIHETLEWIQSYNKQNAKLPTIQMVLKSFDKRLKSKRLSLENTELLLERGSICLSAYLKQRGPTILPTNIGEYSFQKENVFIGDVHMSGKIDKLIVNETDKTITIVDYKTGRAYKRWEPIIKLHLYAQQLYFYKLLVEQSRTFASYKVTDAYLEFVEPDSDGLIRELHIDLNDQESARLQLLATAIWQQIQSLHFPETEDYPTNLKGIDQFEKDLISHITSKNKASN